MISSTLEQSERDLIAWLKLVRDKSVPYKLKKQTIEQLTDVHAVVDRLQLHLSTQHTKQDMQWLIQESQHLIGFDSEHYPPQLKEIADPPLALFAKGDLSLLREPQLAMVGSRKPSPIGQTCAQRIAAGLAEMGIVINSGLALGVDGIAHRSALQAGGNSVAVLGGAFDHVSPKQHLGLYEALTRDGLVLSEYPLGVPPSRYTFPQRNRIVSGLSLGVIIVEAAEKSGTLITARLALEQNRELMVVPGSALSQQYSGSNRLIQDGAALVTNAHDVVQQLRGPLTRQMEEWKTQLLEKHSSAKPSEAKAEPNSASLLAHIDSESTSVDSLVRRSGKSVEAIMQELLELELEGRIARDAIGGYVSLT